MTEQELKELERLCETANDSDLAASACIAIPKLIQALREADATIEHYEELISDLRSQTS